MTKKVLKAVKARKPQKPSVVYSQVLMTGIIKRIAAGEMLPAILKSSNMPTADAFYDWLARYPEHKEAYDQARVQRLELMVEEITHEPAFTEEEKAHPILYSKLRDRKQKSVMWLAERLNRQLYGNHVSVEQKHTIDLKPLLSRVEESIKRKGMKSVGNSFKSREKPLELVEADRDEQSRVKTNK